MTVNVFSFSELIKKFPGRKIFGLPPQALGYFSVVIGFVIFLYISVLCHFIIMTIPNSTDGFEMDLFVLEIRILVKWKVEVDTGVVAK